ncbi:uncharacterized protein LOC143334879 [Chaetodon auriga]|uniref:uncharacterized protein LOC143334879 n=1 Tax=Chaetodon auriga TaxID=39042 RepID=UPI004032D1C3
MQPIEAQKGVSAKSQLFNSLKVYLNNKSRLQPIIGLGNIMECVTTGTHNREALYLCEVCVCRLSKADIRNHIMGSLHRYNYIKAWHPHLVPEWKENSDLSKLAWPLMELATMLEGKEGPGDVQLFEIEDAVYQRMATCSENDAVILINLLRDGQGEPESDSGKVSVQLEHCPIQSQRIVVLAQNKWRQSKKSFKTSAGTNKPPSLIQSTVTPSVKSEDWFNNTYSSLSDNTQMSPFSDLSENNSFLDGYTGTTPLIGLFRVVECKSEDGHTYCFLCHCCRVRSNQKDIIDHLTGSSHLVNYLMETRPEQMEVSMADITDNYQLLQSLAKKVEHDEGRGEMKVVKAPESLCILLTSKSYHWCIKMLCNESMCTSTQKSKLAIKGPNVNKTSNQGLPGKCAVAQPKRMQTKRKMKKVSNTVFKVNLPITKHSVLLERTPFSLDNLPVSLDFDTGSFSANHAEHTSMSATSELQQDFYTEEADAGQCMGPQRNFVSHYQEVGGYFSGSEYFSQPEWEDGWQNGTCGVPHSGLGFL